MAASSDNSFLGLNGSTESWRLDLFTPDGVTVTFAREEYSIHHGRSKWAEQDPAEWWTPMARGVRRALKDTGVSPGSAVGLSIAGTSYTLGSSDANGTRLRTAIPWMEVHAHTHARLITATSDLTLKYRGYSHASARWIPPKAIRLKSNEPGAHERTAWIANAAKWMDFKPTGERTRSINSTTTRCYCDGLAGGWPPSHCAAIGLPKLTAKIGPRVLNLGAHTGPLSPKAAGDLGLCPGTSVASGRADALVGQSDLELRPAVAGPIPLDHLARQPHPSGRCRSLRHVLEPVPAPWSVPRAPRSDQIGVLWYRKDDTPKVRGATSDWRHGRLRRRAQQTTLDENSRRRLRKGDLRSDKFRTLRVSDDAAKAAVRKHHVIVLRADATEQFRFYFHVLSRLINCNAPFNAPHCCVRTRILRNGADA